MGSKGETHTELREIRIRERDTEQRERDGAEKDGAEKDRHIRNHTLSERHILSYQGINVKIS